MNNSLKFVNIDRSTKTKWNSFDSKVTTTSIELNLLGGLIVKNKQDWDIDFRKITNTNNNIIDELAWNLLNHCKDEKNKININNLYLTNTNLTEKQTFSDNFSGGMVINHLIIVDTVAIPNNYFQDITIHDVNVEGLDGKKSSISSIGKFAFWNSKISGTLNLNNISSIGAYAFYGNQIKKINFYGINKITEIPDFTFSDNPNLKVNIPSYITSVSNSAFSDWTNITRAPNDDDDYSYNPTTGILHFKKISSSYYHSYWDKINGIKINKITFDPSILVLPTNIFQGLRTSNITIKVDLSGISIINENSFSSKFEPISDTMGNIIYNNPNSGISIMDKK